jgi:hypothetical protein
MTFGYFNGRGGDGFVTLLPWRLASCKRFSDRFFQSDNNNR